MNTAITNHAHNPASDLAGDTAAPVLSVNDITVTFPDGDSTLTVLDRVSLEIVSGEVTMLTGESGSGKSTLLAVIAGLSTPTAGTVTLEGTDITGLSDTQRADIRLSRMGIIFQQPNLLGALNAREQLLMMDHVRGVRGAKLRARAAHADELLARVGLAGKGERKLSELSGGQRQRVGIARALMNDPALLLADEPTSALDSRLSAEVMELLTSLTHDLGCATLIITHDRSQLERADRVLSLVDGHLQPSPEPADAAIG